MLLLCLQTTAAVCAYLRLIYYLHEMKVYGTVGCRRRATQMQRPCGEKTNRHPTYRVTRRVGPYSARVLLQHLGAIPQQSRPFINPKKTSDELITQGQQQTTRATITSPVSRDLVTNGLDFDPRKHSHEYALYAGR